MATVSNQNWAPSFFLEILCVDFGTLSSWSSLWSLLGTCHFYEDSILFPSCTHFLIISCHFVTLSVIKTQPPPAWTPDWYTQQPIWYSTQRQAPKATQPARVLLITFYSKLPPSDSQLSQNHGTFLNVLLLPCPTVDPSAHTGSAVFRTHRINH